jgi:hypothetical protein
MAKTIVAPRPDGDVIRQAIEKSRQGLEPMADIANALDCPLWMLLIPDMPAEGLKDGNRAELEQLVNAFLEQMRRPGEPAATVINDSQVHVRKAMAVADLLSAVDQEDLSEGTARQVGNVIFDLLESAFDRLGDAVEVPHG